MIFSFEKDRLQVTCETGIVMVPFVILIVYGNADDTGISSFRKPITSVIFFDWIKSWMTGVGVDECGWEAKRETHTHIRIYLF